MLAFDQGEYAAAQAYYEESLAIRQEIGDRQSIAGSLHNLGTVAQSQGEYAAARTCYEEARIINRETGNRAWEAFNSTTWGM